MNRRNLLNRTNKKKSLTCRISSDIIDMYIDKLLTHPTGDNAMQISFRQFFSTMDASHKAVFYNEFVNVWGLDKDELMDRTFFDALLTHVQEDNVRAGF